MPEGREFARQCIKFGHGGEDCKTQVTKVTRIYFHSLVWMGSLILRSCGIVGLETPIQVLVEGQTIELLSFHRLARAPGKEDDRHNDGEENGGPNSNGNGFENKPDRVPDKTGDGLKNCLGNGWGGGVRSFFPL